jgi:hypothetical protein
MVVQQASSRYRSALQDCEALLQIDSDIIKKLRKQQPYLSRITAKQILEDFPRLTTVSSFVHGNAISDHATMKPCLLIGAGAALLMISIPAIAQSIKTPIGEWLKYEIEDADRRRMRPTCRPSCGTRRRRRRGNAILSLIPVSHQ